MQRRLRNLFSLNKKGMLYEIGLIFFVIIILSAALYNILTSQSLTSQIGKTPADIIRVDKEAQLKLDLIEKASTYYIYNAIIELVSNSGYNKEQLNLCQDWNKRKECILTQDKLKENLRTYLRSSFNDLTKQEKLNFYNIDINILDNKLIIADFNGQNLKFVNNDVEYTINHKFRKQVVYDLNKITNLYNYFSSQVSLNSCPAKESIEPICIEENGFLKFELKQNKFTLKHSLEYPIEPVIKFKLKKSNKAEII